MPQNGTFLPINNLFAKIDHQYDKLSVAVTPLTQQQQPFTLLA